MLHQGAKDPLIFGLKKIFEQTYKDFRESVQNDSNYFIKFIEEIEKSKAQILCLSTLMSPTLDEMRLIVEKLKKKGFKDKVKVMIGGATTNLEFKEEIGADFYCKDAIEAVNTLDKHFSN